MTVSSASRQRGAAFELDLLKWFRSKAQLPAERLRLAGKFDEGDLAVQDVGLTYVVEAKNEAKINLTGYVREALVEADNYARARGISREKVMPLVIVKKRNAPIDDAFVVVPLSEFFNL